jgi:hypothetical protein
MPALVRCLLLALLAGSAAACARLPSGYPAPEGWYGQNPDPRVRRPGPHGRFDTEHRDDEPFAPPDRRR